MLLRLLRLLGFARPAPPPRVEPYFGPSMSNITDLEREREKRMRPVIFVGFMSDADVERQRRGEE